jgi:signal peptidase I
MIPTLLVGDLILVNKFHYGIGCRCSTRRSSPITTRAAGDVMVFRYPVDPRIDYIKRVVGVPGDEVSLPQSAPDDQRQEAADH